MFCLTTNLFFFSSLSSVGATGKLLGSNCTSSPLFSPDGSIGITGISGSLTDSTGSLNISSIPSPANSSWGSFDAFLAFILDTYTDFGTHLPVPPSGGCKQNLVPHSRLLLQSLLSGSCNTGCLMSSGPGSGITGSTISGCLTGSTGSLNISPIPSPANSSWGSFDAFLAFILDTYTDFGTHLPVPPSGGCKQNLVPHSRLLLQSLLSGSCNTGCLMSSGPGSGITGSTISGSLTGSTGIPSHLFTLISPLKWPSTTLLIFS